MKKIILLIVLVALGFFGYKYYQKMNTEVEPTSEIQNEIDVEDITVEEVVDNEELEVVDMHESEDVLDYTGLYQGNLPCADCSSIFTNLELKADGAYKLSEHYRKSQEVSDYYKNDEGMFKEEGKYTVENGVVTIVLKDGSEKYYQIEEGTLVALNDKKEKTEGELAEDYVLKKVSEEIPSFE